jgi:probable F420-dependent oxidoreductase
MRHVGIIMKIGITLPQFGSQATKENVIRLAKMAEQEHFDSLWVGERLLWPINPQTPYPGSPDGGLPTSYQSALDPLVTLTFAASNTDKIALGTCVIDMLFHNPVILGRQFATLDVLSQGRCICGLGIGWSKDEYVVSNVPFEHRAARADEFVQALTRIWTEDVVEFKGRYYNIPASKIGPKPVQKPRIPVYLGGFSPNTLSRIAEYADGWLPAAGGSLEYLANGIKTLNEKEKKENKHLEIIALTFPEIITNSHKENGVRRAPLNGTIDDVGSDIRRIKEIGVNHVIFGLTEPDPDRVIDTAKQLSKSIK